MRSETQPYSTVLIAIQLCRTAHAIFFPKFWNDKMNFTRVFVTVSPRRLWDRGCLHTTVLSVRHFLPQRSRLANQKLCRSREWAGNKTRSEVALNPSIK